MSIDRSIPDEFLSVKFSSERAIVSLYIGVFWYLAFAFLPSMELP